MAGKKAKAKPTVQKPRYGKLQPDDVLCPICRTIFDHPVTLPCNHAFCRPCFEGSMANANLMCPLCRLRVGSWYRRTKKDGKLVNEELWKAVQQQYPLEVKNKLQGLDNDIEEGKPVVRVCNPGEIRQEYEKERRKYLEQQQKTREAEENDSAVLIKKLSLEAGFKETVEEERLRWNAMLAKKLSEKLLSPSTSTQTPQKPKVSKKFGPMDRLVQTGDWITTHGFSQQTKIPPKKKQPQNSPKCPKACFSKEYTCHMIPVAKNPLRFSREKSFLDFGVKPSGRVDKSLKLVAGQRKLCVSGYKSSTSAENSDVIDQECRFYFKPIDSQRRFHAPGMIPRKVVPQKGVRDYTVSIGRPSGKVHCLGNVNSAFLKVPPKGKTMPARNEIEKESSPNPIGMRTEHPKRTILRTRQSPMKKMRMYNESESDQGRMESPPFYGFDNSDKTLGESPFSGFDANNVRDSENKMQMFADFISKSQRCETTERLEIASGSRRMYTESESDQERMESPPFYGFDNRDKTLRESLFSGFDANNVEDSENRTQMVADFISKLQRCETTERLEIARVSRRMFTESESDQEKMESPPFYAFDNSEKTLRESPFSGFNANNVRDSENKTQMFADFISKLQRCETTERLEIASISSGRESSSSKENNFEANIPKTKTATTKPSRNIITSPGASEDQRRVQEEADYQLAKKLQAAFDLIGAPVTTRGRRRRQITLDEMLVV